MYVSRRFRMLAVALLASLAMLALGACAGEVRDAGPEGTPGPAGPVETAVPAETPRPPESATRTLEQRRADGGPFFGIAGLVPPHFPDSTDDDWLQFFRALPSLGGSVGNYSQLEDLARNHEVGLAAGARVLPVTSFHVDTGTGVLVTVDFDDPAQKLDYLNRLIGFVRTHQPALLGVGNEVNRIWEEDPEAFDAWVRALPEIVNAIHTASPETQVFATFQYEFLIGRAAITGQPRVEDWTPFDAVAPHLALVAFTTYPYFEFASPEEIPDDYYEPIAQRTDLPVGFTEVGWPSAPISPLARSGLEDLGGTPEQQAQFVERLESLFSPVDLAFAMWVWAYDTDEVGPTFASLGLHEYDGTPKPSLAAWRTFIAR